MSWIFVMLLAAILASLVQGVTGFGSGIMLMIFLPTMLPIGQSAGVSTLTMLIAEVVLVWRYRHALQWRRLPLPFLVYASVATWSVHLGKILPTHFLKALLGALLIALCLYFTLNHTAGSRRFPLVVAVGFMIISGFFNGLFGIGGPLMALYFLTLAKTKEEYLVSIQTFFLIDTFYVTTVRFAQQVLRVADLKYVVVGMIGAVIGTIVANRIVDHLNVAMITRVVYGFIGVAGAYYLITALVTSG
ncbi:TSUP family transporter [Lacticaseibacillus sp. N501-2]|uniref:TSUP family transporter n=1 Tax=Lacticaseibacillus salsurae TaxID=3367729 RepID=UPI0038B31844